MTLPPLYKYLDFRGAVLTLGNRTFKHAKPSDFNDTEDLTVQSIFPEETELAAKKIAREFIEVILQHLNVPPTCKSPMKEQLQLIQQAFRDNPAAAEVVHADLNRDGAKRIFDIASMRAADRESVKRINELLQATRVLCVTTHRASERMWVEYAENHKGVVLRIEPNLAKDSKFQRFRPVVYRETRPPLYETTHEYIAGGLFGDFASRVQTMIDRIIYTKTLNWSHEGEYRLAIPLRQNETPWNTDPYNPEEITELYIGLSMERRDADRIVGMAQAVNPRIAVFRMKRGGDGSLEFEPI